MASFDSADRFVERLIRDAEIKSETSLALFRLAGLLVFGLLLRVFDFVGHDHVFLMSFTMYALAVGAGLMCAWRRVYHGAIPWLITTAEVAVVLHFQVMLVLHEGYPIDAALGVPASLLLYLTLAQGAARCRLYLVLCTGGLALAGVAALHFALAGFAGQREHGISLEEIARLALTGTMAATFYLIARRTRSLLWRSLREARWRSSLARFVPSGLVAERAASGWIDRKVELRRAAIMLVDIRGFTALSEGSQRAAVMALLDEFRHQLVPVIEQHGGAIGKFIGDAIMAVFSAGEGVAERAASNAVRCLGALRTKLKEWNAVRTASGALPIRVGIGLHYGDVVAGVLGDDDRLEYTVIGDTGNVAQRLESLSSQLDTFVVVLGEAFLAGVPESDRAAWRTLPPQAIRGITRDIELYTLT